MKTIVSCASPFVHLNSEIFKDPYAFRPERWLEDPGLDKWLVAFSKGPRSCLGIKYVSPDLRDGSLIVFLLQLSLDGAAHDYSSSIPSLQNES